MDDFFHSEVEMIADSNDASKENVYIHGKHVFGPAPVSDCVKYVAQYLKLGDGDTAN